MTQKQFTLEDFPSLQQQQQTLNIDNHPQMEDCQDLGMFTFSNRSRKMSVDQFFYNQEIQSQQYAELQCTQFFQQKSQQNTNNFLFTLPEPTGNQQQQPMKNEDFIQDSSNSEEEQQFTPFDLSNPFVSLNTQQQEQEQESNEIRFEDVQDLSNKKKSFSMKPFMTIIPQKKQAKKKRGNFDKNICRYLTRKVIRCFASSEYKEKVLSFSQFDEDLYFEATEFFLRRIEKITGFRVLKQYLQYPKLSEIPVEDEQSRIERVYCIVFKKFYLWFLKERMNRYILNGKMEDKQMYIKYKNEVMLNYSEALDSWTSNKNLKKQQRRK